jgi:hypothetical protein
VASNQIRLENEQKIREYDYRLICPNLIVAAVVER